MQQEQLFIETETQAVEHLAARVGGLKFLASVMYPDVPVDVAHKNLLNKLNPNHAAVWSSDDRSLAIRVSVHHDCLILRHWHDDNEGFQHSQPLEPKDSDEELVKRMEDAAAVMAKCVDILDRRKSAKLKAVK